MTSETEQDVLRELDALRARNLPLSQIRAKLQDLDTRLKAARSRQDLPQALKLLPPLRESRAPQYSQPAVDYLDSLDVEPEAIAPLTPKQNPRET